MTCLPKSFYTRATPVVAKELIGHTLVRVIEKDGGNVRLSGTIVETEAYGYREDDASHAFRGQTSRNSVMFGEVGCAYVYLSYGVHYCLNISARSLHSEAGAVLFRSVYPLEGVNVMKGISKKQDLRNLSRGPGKLTKAMNITSTENGKDMTNESSDLRIEEGIRPSKIASTARIGISRGINRAWRFVDVSSPYLSRPVSHARRPRLK